MNFELRSSALWLNLFMLSFCLAADPSSAATAQEDALKGCWRHETEQGKYKYFHEICLGDGGKAEVVKFRKGHGEGRNAKWSIVDDKLSLTFASDSELTCQFDLTGNSKLTLSECGLLPPYPDVFVRMNTSGDSTTRNSICWGRHYPDNGDFEIAQIAERVPIIVELEQQLDDGDHAEAGNIVVVWSRSGQYACVENVTDAPENYFWVDQGSLGNVPDAPGEDPWAGNYKRVAKVEITSVGDGKYDVYGEIGVSMAHGFGWSSDTSNEIFANAVKPRRNTIELTLRRNITTAGAKAPPGVVSPGFIDERCKPVMFVKGLLLLIKDKGECGDGSVAEGYYLRQ